MGIPTGNTVALAGDPGTGKTTFLLTLFRHAISKGSHVEIDTDHTTGQARRALGAFNQIVRPGAVALGHNKENAPRGPTLRCFVSLESSFERICTNHSTFMSFEQKPQIDTPHRDDVLVFIDATSFLSGRLEDKLRYPRLGEHQANHDDKDTMGVAWKPYDFTIGGYETGRNENIQLYWQPFAASDRGRPVRIDQIGSEAGHPFLPYQSALSSVESVQPEKQKSERLRLFNLVTMPVADPLERIRLLKDLLAELFANFGPEYTKILSVDSLSALLSTHITVEAEVNSEKPGRRLHIINLVRWLEENNVTSIMACEAVRGGQTMGNHNLFLGTQERYLASGVIQLDYHQYSSGDLIRFLRVLKMRGAAHDMRPFAYDLGPYGINWLEPMSINLDRNFS
ncbi:MAG: hypothetical protein MRY59_05740 [Aquisalinus sp.]|nr:hypothetical protein [Aquisalinus sp.]